MNSRQRIHATLADHGGAWTPEALDGFIGNPRGYASGTKMTYSGLKDVAKRADLIAYLAAQGG